MKRPPSLLAGLASALWLSATGPVGAAARTFVSPAGFSVGYPPGWRPVGRGGADLLLVSPGRGAHGPVIGEGQAALLVRSLGAAPSQAEFDRLMAGRSADPAAGRRRLRAVPPTGDCADLTEFDTRDASGPGPVELDFSFYCQAAGRAVVVQLTHYAGDPRHAAYVRDALRVAGALRLEPQR